MKLEWGGGHRQGSSVIWGPAEVYLSCSNSAPNYIIWGGGVQFGAFWTDPGAYRPGSTASRNAANVKRTADESSCLTSSARFEVLMDKFPGSAQAVKTAA